MSMINRALRTRQDIDQFVAKWPELPRSAYPLVSFSWEQLERQLADLAETPVKRELAVLLVSGTRKQAWAKPPEMVLRELLAIAATLSDESFHPSVGGETDTMT